MGRLSKAKLLGITLKLQQNLCANCLTPIKQISEKTTTIKGNSKVKRKLIKPCRILNKSTEKERNEISVSDAVRIVFEAALKLNKVSISSTDIILYMCEECASSISELYWAYVDFLELTKQDSYIRSAIKACLIWKDEKNSQTPQSPLNETPSPNFINEQINSEKLRTSLEIEKIEEDDGPDHGNYFPEQICTSDGEACKKGIKLETKTERRRKLALRSKIFRNTIQKSSIPTISSVKKKKTSSNNKKREVEVVELRHNFNLRQRQIKKVGPAEKPETKQNKEFRKRAPRSAKAPVLQFICGTCGKKCTSSTLLKTHTLQCKKIVKNSVCRYCGKKFSLKLLRDRHENIFHTQDLSQRVNNKLIACKECGKTFKNLTFLRRHASVHSTVKPFQCVTCLKSFKRFDTLQEHQRGKSHTLSLGPKSRPYVAGSTAAHTCKICKQVFKHKVSLFRHESKLHNMEERPFGCKKCWKRYRIEEKLRNHIKTAHENVKEKERVIYSCELCDKTYTYLYSYKAHVVTHAIDKPFLCSQCGSSFRQKQGFLRHMSTMHKPENNCHICNICGKSFKRKDHLTQHLRGKTHGQPTQKDKTSKSKQQSSTTSESSTPQQLKKEEISPHVISHTNKTTNVPINSASSISALTLQSRTTTTLVIEPLPLTSTSHPSTTSNTGPANAFRPGVIVPLTCEAHTVNNVQNNEMANQPAQPSNFAFTASNLFFDF